MFSQAYLICDWWFNVDCQDSESFRNVNDELYKIPKSSSATNSKPYQSAQTAAPYRQGVESYSPRAPTGHITPVATRPPSPSQQRRYQRRPQHSHNTYNNPHW